MDSWWSLENYRAVLVESDSTSTASEDESEATANIMKRLKELNPRSGEEDSKNNNGKILPENLC